ncbi:RluA family pseudouridine synthase [soil metagenome]
MAKLNFEDLILFENQDYIVINKLSHISTLDERTGDAGSILAMARDYHPDVQMNHRLDKETSGALAIAKNPEAYRALSMQFENREVKKIYHAVCDGLHNFKDHQVNAPIISLEKGIVKINFREGKPTETIFNTIAVYRAHTLVSCMPVTGRMHQIRIHLSYINAPITGDDQYGGKPFYLSSIKKKFNLKKDTDELPLFRRVALHASSLSFRLRNDEIIEVEAPYPKDFKILILQLEKNS